MERVRGRELQTYDVIETWCGARIITKIVPYRSSQYIKDAKIAYFKNGLPMTIDPDSIYNRYNDRETNKEIVEISKKDIDILLRCKNILKELSTEYVANAKSDNTFISCITCNEESKTHKLWLEAYEKSRE